MANIVGKDGQTGPVATTSIAGTQATGELEEIRVDSDGKLLIGASVSTQDVNIVKVLGTATSVDAGAVDAGTQRTTLASDDPAVALLATIDADTSKIPTLGTEDSALGANHDGAVPFNIVADYDGSALPTGGDTEGDAVIPAASGQGVAYSMITTENGSKTPVNQNTGNIDAAEQDPVDEHYAYAELIDTTNVGAATNYYPSSAGQALANYNNVSTHMECSGGVTATFEGKIDDSTDWVDISKMGVDLNTGVTGAASWVDKNTIVDFDDIHVRHVRIKSVTADATNGVQYHWKLTAI